MQNKKTKNISGFTLIEVVVALGVLTAALTGSVTLVVNVVNLALITRDTTEATALLHKGLADAQTKSEACCGGLEGTTITDTTPNGKTLNVTINNTASTDSDFNDGKFYKVHARVSWTFRNNTTPHAVEATEYLRKDSK